jgi:hypothetical protein
MALAVPVLRSEVGWHWLCQCSVPKLDGTGCASAPFRSSVALAVPMLRSRANRDPASGKSHSVSRRRQVTVATIPRDNISQGLAERPKRNTDLSLALGMVHPTALVYPREQSHRSQADQHGLPVILA